jgi:hypothetical protein
MDIFFMAEHSGKQSISVEVDEVSYPKLNRVRWASKVENNEDAVPTSVQIHVSYVSTQVSLSILSPLSNMMSFFTSQLV